MHFQDAPSLIIIISIKPIVLGLGLHRHAAHVFDKQNMILLSTNSVSSPRDAGSNLYLLKVSLQLQNGYTFEINGYRLEEGFLAGWPQFLALSSLS